MSSAQRWAVRSFGAVEPDRGVHVNGGAGLELDHLGVRDPTGLAEGSDLQSDSFRELSLKPDGESAPQFGRVPLPEHLAGVVVALPAQRLPDLGVAVTVPFAAPERATVLAERLVPTASAWPLGSNAVDRAE